MNIRTLFATALACAALSLPAQAAGGPPPDIEAKLRELGRVVDPPHTAVLYAPLQEHEPYAGVTVRRDVAYGPAPLQKLDVFTADAKGGAPVLVSVHGGAFIRGTKHAPGSPFDDQVPLWAARHGMVGVNIDYRLAPAATYPAAAEDIGAALTWVGAHIRELGGDPKRIILMGHSAGAVHVATYVGHRALQPAAAPRLAGAIMISGIYDLKPGSVGDAERVYFGTDPALYPARSALRGLVASPIPLMIAHAELDPPVFVAQFDELRDALCKSAKGCVRSVELAGPSHMSEWDSINTTDTTLGDQILAFVKQGR